MEQQIETSQLVTKAGQERIMVEKMDRHAERAEVVQPRSSEWVKTMSGLKPGCKGWGMYEVNGASGPVDTNVSRQALFSTYLQDIDITVKGAIHISEHRLLVSPRWRQPRLHLESLAWSADSIPVLTSLI
jgi:hypothetical protein